MRDIKFRVWDNDSSKMYPVLQLFTSCGSTYPKVRVDDKNENEDWLFTKDFVIQQFTGLKDKNDREIYEGDIIKGPHDFGPGGWHERTGTIEFHKFNGYSWEYWDIKHIEVVGNIFENPELLKI